MEMYLPGKRVTIGTLQGNKRSANYSREDALQMGACQPYSIEVTFEELQNA